MRLKPSILVTICLMASTLIVGFIGSLFPVPDNPSQARERLERIEEWRISGEGKSVAEAQKFLDLGNPRSRIEFDEEPYVKFMIRAINWRPWILVFATLCPLILMRPSRSSASIGAIAVVVILVVVHSYIAAFFAAVGLLLYLLLWRLLLNSTFGKAVRQLR